MRLFVTGGAGFIGSNYVRHVLAGTDDEVTVFDALTYAGNLANLRDLEGDARYRFVKGDITDRSAVLEAMAGHGAVVHFAAESHVDRSIVSPDEFVRTNCDGTNVIMDIARRLEVERVLHVSTDEVYGSIAEGSFRESDPLGPRSPYSASKAGSDLIAMSYSSTYGVPVLYGFVGRGLSLYSVMKEFHDEGRPLWNTEFGIDAGNVVNAWGVPHTRTPPEDDATPPIGIQHTLELEADLAVV